MMQVQFLPLVQLLHYQKLLLQLLLQEFLLGTKVLQPQEHHH